MNSACSAWFENLKIEKSLSIEKPVLSINMKYKHVLAFNKIG